MKLIKQIYSTTTSNPKNIIQVPDHVNISSSNAVEQSLHDFDISIDDVVDWKDSSNVINDSHHTSINSQPECLDIFTEVKMLRSKDRKRPLIGKH